MSARSYSDTPWEDDSEPRRLPTVLRSGVSRRIFQKPLRNYFIASILILLLLTLSGGVATTAPQASHIPTFNIVSVVENESVTVETHNFPANRDFVVRMDPFGDRAIDGTPVETINSGDGGSFTATFTIPEALEGLNRIAIRMDSQTGGFFAYNWFWNNTATVSGDDGDDGTGGEAPPPDPDYTGIPTFSIVSVVEDESVTVETHNFPANRDFVVRMDPFGDRAIDGTPVETINSGDGGSFTATFTIPEALEGLNRIAIRMDSQTGGFFAYNWFWNNTTD